MTWETLLVILFYIFVGICLCFFWAFYRFVNQPKFRNEEGDLTTEVGYEEDSVGNVIPSLEAASHETQLSGPHIVDSIRPDTGDI